MYSIGTLAQSPPTFDDGVSYNKTFNQNYLTDDQVFDVDCTYSSNPDDLRYSIEAITPPPSPLFLTINDKTGFITLIEDALSIAVNQYALDLRCRDISNPTMSTTMTLYLSREEENEFQPVFEETTLSYSISEAQEIMQVVFNDTATDDDLGVFGEVEYATEGAFPAEFSLDNSTGEVSLVASLDYEETPMYQFILVAFNPADQSSRTSVLIVIDVTDVDDEYPEFQYPDPSNQAYSTTVPETYPAGGYDIPPPGFLTVNCTDPDTAPTGITYAISSTNPGPFTIDQDSGALSVTKKIDLDVPVLDPSSYSFTVMCQDAANHTDSALVDITISPLNEFGPSFDGEIGSIFIDETYPEVGTAIAATNIDIPALRYYEVVDDDVPPEIFSYFLSDAPGVEFFEIDKNTGTLTLAHSIDVDSAPSQFVLISFQIIVCDTEFLRTDCPELTIGFFVLAANDDFPGFSPESYDVMFDDGTPVLTELLEASCTDGDVGVGEFDGIEFSSDVDTLSEIFLLDEVSGLIQNKIVLDYENVPGYGFSLVCFDTEGNTATATVNITITPLNDEEPAFTQTSYAFELSRTAEFGYVVGDVSATDADKDVGSTLTYTTDLSAYFVVTDDGKLVLITSVLNYPDPEFLFTVEVSDGVFTVDVDVAVLLTDGNFEPPMFAEGSTQTISVSELSPPDTPIVTLVCNDSETGLNGETELSITSGNTGSAFKINPQTGLLSVASVLILPENVTEEVYILNIRCQDKGVPVFSDFATVLLRVHIDTSVPPVIGNETIVAFVSEDAMVNDVVVQVEALGDPDCVRTFTLANLSVANSFLIDPNSGEVQVAILLDREKTNMYDMVVEVTEQCGTISPVLSDSALLQIFVRDVNDNDPICDVSALTSTIEETLLPGNLILELSCSDPDFGDNGNLQYELSKNFGILNITASGQIFLQNPLNQTDLLVLFTDVTVSDQGEPARTNTYQISIFISSINRNQPAFVNLPETISIGESTPALQVIFAAMAVDEDRGTFGKVTFGLVGNEDSEAFGIVPNTGDIYPISKPNFHVKSNYTLIISASDSDFTVTAILKVLVEDENEYQPQCDSSNSVVNIAESVAPGVILDDKIQCSDEDLGSNGEISYTITSGDASNTFSVLDDGSLMINEQLDYETEQSYSLVVNVSDGGSPSLSQIVTISVVVLPVNEFTPEIEQALYTETLSENADIGEVVLTITATDMDLPSQADGQLTYKIEGLEQPHFIITSGGILQVASDLDRETTSFYNFTVRVSDGASPPRSDSASIEISIEDVDDNPPVFEKSLYAVTLNRTTEVGTKVEVVKCNDPDIGINAEVDYFILEGDGDYFDVDSESGAISVVQTLPVSRLYSLNIECAGLTNANFSDDTMVSIQVIVESNITFYPSRVYEPPPIPENAMPVISVIQIFANSSTGTPVSYEVLNHKDIFVITDGDLLTIIFGIDYEETDAYVVRILASDNGDPPNTGEAEVHVLVQNVNDESPNILTAPSTITLPEEMIPSSVIGSYECTDDDEGEFGQVQFSIASGDPSGSFAISTSSGQLTLQQKLDYETMQSYSLVIACTDMGEPALSDTITVPVNVGPINDNAPQFPVEPFMFTIVENLPLNSMFGEIVATDNDLPPHNNLYYQIISGNTDPQKFTIVSSTGELSIIQPLDYETIMSFKLTVLVEDGGGKEQPGFEVLNDTTTVSILIVDYNDNSPKFSATVYAGTIEETNITGSQVNNVQLMCTDLDSGSNGQTTLSIESGNTNDVFKITETGFLALDDGKIIDFEMTPSYTLTVLCQDNGQPSLSTESQVIISVVNVNEHGPVFNQSLYTFTVSELATLGTEVGAIFAEDRDAAEAGVVTYSFSNSTEVTVFILDENNGGLTLAQSLDYETDSLYVYSVAASDSAGSTDAAIVVIKVINENDNSPTFSKSSYFANINENAGSGTSVTQVSCTDKDDEADGVPVEYSFASSMTENPFSIDDELGGVFVIDELDLEKIPRYTLVLQCQDSAGTVETASLVIDLNPFNDHAPVFVNAPYTTLLTENPAMNSLVFEITATDDDNMKYGLADTVFNITAGNEEGGFEIDSTTGAISVANSIDREMTALYVLTLEASNVIAPDDTSGSLPLSSETTLTINIVDLNDNSPVITPDGESVFIPDSEGPNYEVGMFICEDIDEGQNGNTSLSLIGNDDNILTLLADGTVITNSALLENKVFTVFCSDMGDPPRTDEALLDIRVTSMNDHAPTFEVGAVGITVAEDVSLGTEVGCFEAADLDGGHGPDGIIEYSITSELTGSSSRFDIDKDTGCVFVSALLDFDDASFYRYTVVASDMGIPSFSGQLLLIIFISQVQEKPPVFVGTPYTRTINEGVVEGTFIVNAMCDDPDGNNTRIVHSITNGNSEGTFSINNATGRITLNEALDYEQETSYTLDVECVDESELSTTEKVFVTVAPLNEFTPIFPSVALDIEEHSILGSTVTSLQWVDEDSGPDGEVTFDITSGNTNDAFIVTDMGLVIISKDLDREVLKFYSLLITISDLSQTPSERKSSTNFVNITILDINDHAPVFESEQYTFEPLQGDEQVGEMVGSVTCNDIDSGMNGAVTYQIAVGIDSALFGINSANGSVYLDGDLEKRSSNDVVFFVECVDGGSPIQRVGSATVLIVVNETNANAPVFTNDTYQVIVKETTDIFATFLTIHATDLDIGVNGKITYLLEDSLDNTFFIGDESGEISILRRLDYESETEYMLTAQAIDGTPDSLVRRTAYVNITVLVGPVNEYTPYCEDPVYVTIINQSSVGVILDLQCSDMDAGDDGILAYTITNGDSTKFNVSGGKVTVPMEILPSDTEQYVLTVAVTDNGSPPRAISVEVIIHYSFENENSPQFTSEIYNFSVSELASVGLVVFNVTATDADLSLQGAISYSLSGTDSFRINEQTGEIFVSQALDWETVPNIYFSVIATDQDPTSPLQDTASVAAQIINENDGAVECALSLVKATVPSTATIGYIVTTISCTDPDSGASQGLQFMLKAARRRQASSYNIDSTGRILVSGPITEPTTLLTVLVVDGDDVTEILVVIHVIFINTEPPIFESSQYVFNVTENTLLLSEIGSVSATDEDSDITDLTFSSETPNNLFYVEPLSGRIFLTAPLDYEDSQQFQFSMVVSDAGSFNGSNILTDEAIITVNVVNANDNAPQLSAGGLYGAVVSENTAINTDILTITCNDHDLPPYGNPVISSTSFEDLPFKLTHVSNEEAKVTVSETPLTSAEYLANVTCSDEGGLSTVGQVFLFVPGPNSPNFIKPLYEWTLSENTPLQTMFEEIKAASFDGSTVTYSIAEGNGEAIFFIDPETASVILVRALDFETQKTHGLIIQAQDGENRQSRVLLIVQVLDINDQVPLTPPSATLQVEQNAPIGYPIGTLQCYDGDTLSNATQFSFTFVTDSTLFSVDSYGIVRLEGALDSTPVHVLPVVCYDTTTPDATSTGIVTIEVVFVNQYEPTFALGFDVVNVSEDSSVLSFVAIVEATDQDVGSYGELTYSITDGNPNKFFIEAATGRIGVLTSLDRETVDTYDLTIMAVDGGASAISDSERKSATTMLRVILDDVNDNPPRPEELSFVEVISTDHGQFEPVLVVNCSDPDLGENAEISYAISPEIEDFIISSEGTILLAKEQSDRAVYNFNVVCSDAGLVPLSSSALVTVVVDFEVLEAPVFDMSEYFVSVEEDIPLQTSIVKLNASTDDPSIDIIYEIESGNENGQFHIIPATGVILLLKNLDASVQQTYILSVKATLFGFSRFFSFATVTITVQDINDEAPEFLLPFYPATVSENAQLVTPVVQVECNDDDVNSEISYALSSTVFNVTADGVIIVASLTDYEKQTIYDLTVTCNDGENTAQTTVRIEVLPVNEFTPVFDQTGYHFFATEHSFGTLLGTIHATDLDAGSDGEITYFLQNPGNSSIVFVDPTVGDVLVGNNLDYEEQSFWSLPVVAVDGGGKQSFVFLNISVNNTNDVKPQLSPQAVVKVVPSDTADGYPIETYVCTDGDGSETNITIIQGNNMGYFDLNEYNQLTWTTVAGGLDTDVVLSLTIQCVDVNAPDQRALGYIAVTIDTGEGNPPVFTQEIYKAEISENAQVGDEVTTVEATSDNEVVYDLFNLPDSFPFNISSSSGTIQLATSLNRETTSFYTFPVRAMNTDSEVAIALVEVTISDENDNPPVIAPSLISVSLAENHGLSEIVSFSCSDEDTGSNGIVEFELPFGNEEGKFSISESGTIVLIEKLDFETQESYNVTVSCSDKGSDPNTALATLLIQVTGINEFPPNFEFENYTFSTSENATAGTTVGSVNATDDDSGINGVVAYAIVGGTGIGFFSIDPSNGMISTTTMELNATFSPEHTLVVVAEDSGPIVSMSHNTLVFVDIQDINEAPQFTQAAYFAVVPTSATGSLVEITCFDVDLEGSDNSLLSLEVTDMPSGLSTILEVDESYKFITGQILANSTLSAGSFELKIQCSDSGNPPLSTSVSVILRIEGFNTPPKFTQPSYTVAVPEDTMPGVVVETVKAIDNETDVEYFITGGNGLGTFVINSQSGAIVLQLSLDYEITQAYDIIVTAYDKNTFNRQSSSVDVFVLVTNVDDADPVISPFGTQVITIAEDTPQGVEIKEYTCVDPDGSDVSFSLAPAYPNSPFSISQNGNVRVENTSIIDDESYELTVRCTDTSNSFVTNELLVFISPVNKFPPMFTSPSEFEVPEDTGVGTVIANITAIDEDTRGDITYTTTSNTDTFIIQQSTGMLTLIKALDYETEMEYLIDVEATDNDIADVPKTASTTVTLRITDVNDNFPSCNPSVVSVSLLTGTYEYLSLANFSCSDADSGLNGQISFEFDEATLPSLSNGVFLLNNSTGELSFQGTLSIPEPILLTIIVSDSGDPQKSVMLYANILVEIIGTRFVPSEFSVTISENTDPSTLIFPASTLNDALLNPQGATVMYTLRENQYSDTFIIDTAGNVYLSSTGVLDYDDGIREYTLTIEAQVGDVTASAVLTVFITDYNDISPMFSSSTETAYIAENAQIGTVVYTVMATDGDSGSNGNISYSLDTETTNFHIDEKTGEITSLRVFDREVVPLYQIRVTATDSGTPPLSGSLLLFVNITDENDNAPMFKDSLYIATIRENSPPGQELLMFEVIDPDLTGTLRFEIDDEEARNLFRVENGILRRSSLVIPTDHPSQYTFTVTVNDEIATGNTTVLIYILDIELLTAFNENQVNQSYDIQNHLNLRDINTTENALYEILEGNNGSVFAISDGKLVNKLTLDREERGEYELIVDVSDTEDFRISIVVLVIDANDNAPMFERSHYNFTVTENEKPGYVLGTIVATDLDTGANGRIEYSIVNAPSQFAINPVTGELFVSGLIDRESQDVYTLHLRAEDFGSPLPNSMISTATVTITDVNDNTPRFDPADVVEFIVETTLGDSARLDNIVAILPNNLMEMLSAFNYSDPDSTDTPVLTLNASTGQEGKFELTEVGTYSSVLFATSDIAESDNDTMLQLVLHDEPLGIDQDPVVRTVTIRVVEPPVQTTATPSASATATTPPTEEPIFPLLNIVAIVIACVLLLALLFLFFCFFSYCYLRIKRKKDPLRARYVNI